MDQQNQINFNKKQTLSQHQPPQKNQQIQHAQRIQSQIKCLLQEAFQKLNEGQHEKSQRLYKKGLELQQQIYGEESIQFAQTLHKIAIVKIYQQLYYEAIKYCIQSLSIKQKVIGKKDEKYISTLYNLGSIYQDLFKYQKSLSVYKKCLQFCQSSDMKNSVLYADILNRIGLLYEIQNLYDQALNSLLDSMKIYQLLEKTQYEGYGHVLNNIGFVYEQMHQYTYAIKFYFCSLEVYKKLFPQYIQNSLNDCYEKTEHNLKNAVELQKIEGFQLLQ